MAAGEYFLLGKNLYHSLAIIKFDIWLEFCSNRSIINLAIGQKLSKTADWMIKSKMAAREYFLLDKNLYHSLAIIKFDIWLKYCSNRSIINLAIGQKLLIGQ